MLSISVAGTREIDPTDAVFRDPSSIGDQGWFVRAKSAVVASVSDILWGATPRPDCIPVGN